MAAAVAQHTETGEPFVRGAECSPFFLCLCGSKFFTFRFSLFSFSVNLRRKNGG